MSEKRLWSLILLGCSLLLGVVMQVPHWLHTQDPAYRGIPVHLNSDEEVYQARVMEALSGRPEQAAEAIVGDPNLRGAQLALIEQTEGTAFSGAGMRAADVFRIMDSVIPVLLFLTLWYFLRACGFSKKQALLGAGLFCLLELYNLHRPVYQRTSFLLTLLALLNIMRGMEGKRFHGIAGGALLGILVSGYFWAWTAAWTWFGLLVAWEVIRWFRSPTRDALRLKRLVPIVIVAVLAALPGVLHTLSLLRDPLYEAAKFRSGMYPSHLPESWPYTVVFCGMLAGLVVAFFHNRVRLRSYRYALLTVLTAFILLHQQVVHGVVFMFASHYLFFLILAAILCVLLCLALRPRSPWLIGSALCACVYLAAIGYDGRYILGQWSVQATHFSQQHFADALPILDDLPRGRILSDPKTSLFLAGFTKHDVVYTVYLKNVLMTHEEIAERYCAEQLPLLPKDRVITDATLLIYPDAVQAFRGDPSVRANEVAMVEEACARLDRDPPAALQRFDVQYVFWDHVGQPKWDLSRLQLPLMVVAQGEGWSLLKL